jgi:hypothetical protein
MPDWVIAILLGLLGGFIRVVISGAVVWPHRRAANGTPRLELGSLGTVLAGGSAGFVLWALVTNQMFIDQGFGLRTVAATILVGIGGGDALMHYLERRHGATVNQQTTEGASEIAKRQANALESLSQVLSEQGKQEDKPKEEANEPKKGGTLGSGDVE